MTLLNTSLVALLCLYCHAEGANSLSSWEDRLNSEHKAALAQDRAEREILRQKMEKKRKKEEEKKKKRKEQGKKRKRKRTVEGEDGPVQLSTFFNSDDSDQETDQGQTVKVQHETPVATKRRKWDVDATGQAVAPSSSTSSSSPCTSVSAPPFPLLLSGGGLLPPPTIMMSPSFTPPPLMLHRHDVPPVIPIPGAILPTPMPMLTCPVMQSPPMMSPHTHMHLPMPMSSATFVAGVPTPVSADLAKSAKPGRWDVDFEQRRANDHLKELESRNSVMEAEMEEYRDATTQDKTTDVQGIANDDDRDSDNNHSSAEEEDKELKRKKKFKRSKKERHKKHRKREKRHRSHKEKTKRSKRR